MVVMETSSNLRGVLLAPLKHRAFWGGQAFAVGAVLAATMLRQMMSPLVHDEMPHIPYLTAVLVVAWRSGFGAGITATGLSAVAANWVFVGEYGRFAFEADDLWATGFFVLFGAAMAWLPARLTAALRHEAELAGRLALVNGELQHRMKNVVAVVQSVINQSARTAASAAELKGKVEHRLHAMSRALELLNVAQENVPLCAVVTGVLEPFRTGRAVKISGPDVSISGNIAVHLALLLHELATNAMKYGALSVPDGVAHLVWTHSAGVTRLCWREDGGPPVREPTHAGFGSRLMRAAMPNGAVSVEYRPDGLVCSVEIRDQPAP